MTAERADDPIRHPLRERRIARLSAPRKGNRRADWTGEPAAIYCRISHARDEDQTGVDRQERLCREIADRLGLLVPDSLVFIDNNRSAWKRDRKRPGWDALLQATREGRVAHVLTYHPDRLMRQPRDLEELLQIADDHNITLHGHANQRDLTDPDDRFFLRIEVAHACRSSDDTSRRLIDSMADRARDGKVHGGKRRFGYETDGVTVIEDEAAVVREIFSRYLDGETASELARELNARGVKTALGASWTNHTVLNVLDSRHVAAVRVFRGEDIGDGTWPAIVERGVWREVQERRTLRAAAAHDCRRRPTTRYYILRGLVMCKTCATRMGGSGHTYLCNRAQRYDDKVCGRKVSANTLEKFVVDAAIKLLEGLEVADSRTTTAQAQAIADEIAVEEAELAELKDMWDSRELTTSEYREMRKKIELRISEAQRRTVVRPTAEVLDGLIGPQAREGWQALEESKDYARMNAVLRFLFDAVIIDASSTRGPRFDYGRIEIEPNKLI